MSDKGTQIFWFEYILTGDICRDTIQISRVTIYRQSTNGGMTMLLKTEPLTESYYYILLCLYKKPNHGYGIMQMVEHLSQGTVKIGSGTMYGATSNMMKKGWIHETISENAEDKRKRLYELTVEGKDVLEHEIIRLKKLVAGSEEILKGVSDHED